MSVLSSSWRRLPYKDGFHRVYSGDSQVNRSRVQHMRDLDTAIKQKNKKHINGESPIYIIQEREVYTLNNVKGLTITHQ